MAAVPDHITLAVRVVKAKKRERVPCLACDGVGLKRYSVREADNQCGYCKGWGWVWRRKEKKV